MDVMTSRALPHLIRAGSTPRCTLYLPSHHGPQATHQAQIALKKLITEAEADLRARHCAPGDVERTLAPAHTLLADKTFWRESAGGVVLFLAADEAHMFQTADHGKEGAFVGREYRIQPLLPMLAEQAEFLILAISQKAVRILQAGAGQLTELHPEGLPTSLKESLRYDDVQMQALFRPTAARGGAVGDAFYGHGAATEEHKQNLMRFMDQLAHSMHLLTRQLQMPVVIAGVANVVAMFRHALGDSGLTLVDLHGNPDLLSPDDLLREGRQALAPLFLGKHRTARQHFEDRAGTGRTAAALDEVLAAAAGGRVESLLVAQDAERWGNWDPAAQRAAVSKTRGPEDEELLNIAVVNTLRHGGQAFIVPAQEMPSNAAGQAAAAVLRF